MNTISVVVPCYNEQEVLPLLYAELDRVAARMAPVRLEFLFVNDGSRDGTLDVLRRLARSDGRVHYLDLSRNFGKEAAMLAGLEHATGDYVAVMDADLQDPPDMLEKMYRILSQDDSCDCVAAHRTNREGEPRVRYFFARRFYRLMNHLSKTEIVDGARDYRLMTRQMTDAVLQVRETNRFTKGIFSWVGFHTRWLPYPNTPRAAGKTKWSFSQLLLYSLDGIMSFSVKPLSLVAVLGLLSCVLSVAGIIFVVVRQLLFGNSAFGWPSMVCILLFVSGVQLLCIGMLGQYLAKTYMETKRRPPYLIRETEKGRPLPRADAHEADAGEPSDVSMTTTAPQDAKPSSD